MASPWNEYYCSMEVALQDGHVNMVGYFDNLFYFKSYNYIQTNIKLCFIMRLNYFIVKQLFNELHYAVLIYDMCGNQNDSSSNVSVSYKCQGEHMDVVNYENGIQQTCVLDNSGILSEINFNFF